MTPDQDSWEHARLALHVLAENSFGLGGLVLRMRAGPDRDQLLSHIKTLFPQTVRITPNVDDLHLFGGVDISATLLSGQVKRNSGLLETPQIIILSMAERCSTSLAAKLSQYLDHEPTAVLIALDEGATDEEKIPPALQERLAFWAEPTGHAPQDFETEEEYMLDGQPDDGCPIEMLATTAEQFGIASMRAPLMALRTARVLAGSDGIIGDSHIAKAAALVFAHRATRTPVEPESDAQDHKQTSEPSQDTSSDTETSIDIPNELVLNAIKALLPPEILAGLGPKQSHSAQGNGQGIRQKGNRRGRPLPSRLGRLNANNRLDLLATLRSAAPWQPIRRKQTPNRSGLLLRPADFRIKRYETKSDRLILFAVDASGSAAVSRLAEVKGAIELLLAQAYAARDHVALVSFRGDSAECLLPPTRSLVQTKRKLAALPGGGGTPLAAGLQEASVIAQQARSRGMRPITVLLTDGKTNVALDGTPDRKQARADAVRLAGHMMSKGLETLVVDSGRRHSPALRDLAQHLDAKYVVLPRADAAGLSNTVMMALDET